jgi:hypothetical protein
MATRIQRCKKTATQDCKDPKDISDFIDNIVGYSLNQQKVIQINNYDINPPLLDQMDWDVYQLSSDKKETQIFSVTKNSYELNDNPFTFLAPPPSQEGEFYNV